MPATAVNKLIMNIREFPNIRQKSYCMYVSFEKPEWLMLIREP